MKNSEARTKRGFGNRGSRSDAKPIGIANALFTATQQKVLGLIFGQPGRSYLATEIIALAGIGSGAVQRELVRLTGSGIIRLERVGRQTHYQANKSSPVFEELVVLVRKTVGLVDPLREALVPLSERISMALVHGSVVRGEAKAGSDIDLLVVADDLPPDELYRALAPTEQLLSRPIHPALLKSDEFDRRKSQAGSFVSRVLAGPVEWLIGGPDVDTSA